MLYFRLLPQEAWYLFLSVLDSRLFPREAWYLPFPPPPPPDVGSPSVSLGSMIPFPPDVGFPHVSSGSIVSTHPVVPLASRGRLQHTPHVDVINRSHDSSVSPASHGNMGSSLSDNYTDHIAVHGLPMLDLSVFEDERFMVGLDDTASGCFPIFSDHGRTGWCR